MIEGVGEAIISFGVVLVTASLIILCVGEDIVEERLVVLSVYLPGGSRNAILY